jgi:hypothetical protein
MGGALGQRGRGAPREGEDGSDEWFGWLYCGDEIAGLPSSDSPEGQRLWADALTRLAQNET